MVKEIEEVEEEIEVEEIIKEATKKIKVPKEPKEPKIDKIDREQAKQIKGLASEIKKLKKKKEKEKKTKLRKLELAIAKGAKARRKAALQAEIGRQRLLQSLATKKRVSVLAKVEDRIQSVFIKGENNFMGEPRKQQSFLGRGKLL